MVNTPLNLICKCVEPQLIYCKEMTEVVISSLLSLLGTVLIGGGVLFYRQTKRFKIAEAKLKEMESASLEKDVLAKDLQNVKTTTAEWICLYEEQKVYSKKLENKIQVLNDELKQKNKDINEYKELDTKQRIAITNLNWEKCVVSDCSKRKPPRNFQILIDDIEDMHDDLNEHELTKERFDEFHCDRVKPLGMMPPIRLQESEQIIEE